MSDTALITEEKVNKRASVLGNTKNAKWNKVDTLGVWGMASKPDRRGQRRCIWT